jgi:hypothetical protein
VVGGRYQGRAEAPLMQLFTHPRQPGASGVDDFRGIG